MSLKRGLTSLRHSSPEYLQWFELEMKMVFAGIIIPFAFVPVQSSLFAFFYVSRLMTLFFAAFVSLHFQFFLVVL
jgi:hypothetical protein